MTEAYTIAFIGFGEAGQRFARDFASNPALAICAYDILFDDARRSERILDRARTIGVAPRPNYGEAIGGADIVFSAVTADATEAAAAEAGRFIARGQIYVDINSASPDTKRRCAAVIGKAGADYIEAAVMAPVLKPGIKVPILAGGPASSSAAALLNGLGMNIESVGPEFGKASAIKLCRSIVIKGMEALMVDCAAACSAFGVADPVFASLSETFPSIDWAKLAEAMQERVEAHGVRRAAEMEHAAGMLAAAGLDPSLALAVRDAQARGARPKH